MLEPWIIDELRRREEERLREQPSAPPPIEPIPERPIEREEEPRGVVVIEL